jgi:hypothetical protein
MGFPRSTNTSTGILKLAPSPSAFQTSKRDFESPAREYSCSICSRISFYLLPTSVTKQPQGRPKVLWPTHNGCDNFQGCCFPCCSIFVPLQDILSLFTICLSQFLDLSFEVQPYMSLRPVSPQRPNPTPAVRDFSTPTVIRVCPFPLWQPLYKLFLLYSTRKISFSASWGHCALSSTVRITITLFPFATLAFSLQLQVSVVHQQTLVYIIHAAIKIQRKRQAP